MKIRTVTVGVDLSSWGALSETLRYANSVGKDVADRLRSEGWEVQTVRVATSPFEGWFVWANADELATKAAEVAKACQSAGVELLSIGPARSKSGIAALPTILKICTCASASAGFMELASVLDEEEGLLEATVDSLFAIANEPGTGGLGCFRYTVSFGCQAGIPFFPAAFHAEGAAPAVYVGLENSGAVVRAFRGCRALSEASASLREHLEGFLVPLDERVRDLCGEMGCRYGGIDASVNPSLDPEESIVLAYEQFVGQGGFGGVGCLAVSQAITAAVQALPIQLSGYSGLMMPVCEDRLLAERAAAQPPAYTIGTLLMYSAVCGVGVDTVPIAGCAPRERVRALLRDTAALAFKWRKPLSCRLFPVPGAKPGDVTTFDSPYLCNTRVFAL